LALQTAAFVEHALLTLSQVVTLLLPITLSGLTLILCMRKGWLRALDVPLDGGLRLGNQPLIGKSKSVRSLVIYLVVATSVTAVLHWLASVTDLVAPVELNNPLILGPICTLAYLAGEIVNSFVKRRFGISTSAQTASRLGSKVQSIFDNIDGILCSGLPMIFIFGVPGELLATSFVLAVLTHLSTNALMRALRLKRQQQN
jgi:CDP-diglyceride synthetase